MTPSSRGNSENLGLKLTLLNGQAAGARAASPKLQKKSSPQTSTTTPVKFTPDERLYFVKMPKSLTDQLSWEEARQLVRVDPKDWHPDLKAKMNPYLEEPLP